MAITKLPSGSYRVQKQIDGKRYSFTFDHRPTQKEINEEVAKRSARQNGNLTLEDACNKYIEARSNVLSPTTKKEYLGYVRRLQDWILNKYIDDITQNDIQRMVNELAVDKSPKTVGNYHGFVAGVFGEFRPSFAFHTKMPRKKKKKVYYPTTQDIKSIIDLATDTVYELPILLGCSSLRRSEICALTMDDIDFENNIIRVCKSKLQDENNDWVISDYNKTEDSTRYVHVPPRAIELIKRDGLFKQTPGSISQWMTRTQKRLGLPLFSLHKCRHYFASQAHFKQICDADIMKQGGWKTDYVMRTIYTHSINDNGEEVNNAVFEDVFS